MITADLRLAFLQFMMLRPKVSGAGVESLHFKQVIANEKIRLH